jgi:hypothetical protein
LTSLSIYSNLNFRDFILLNHNFAFSDYQPLIFDFPIPGFSTIYFLITYLLIISIKRLHLGFVLLLTILTSLDFYINPIDALFLIGIWSRYLLLLKPKGINLGVIFFQFLVILSIISIGLFSGNLSFENTVNLSIPNYNLLAYLILPLVLIFVLYYIKRIDFYEIYNRFSHVYIFMAIEFSVVIVSSSKILPIDLDIFETRILQFFIHLFYYVPIIYFLAKPRVKIEYAFGSEASFISKKMTIFSDLVYNFSEKFLTIVVTIMLISYNLFPLINSLK